MKLVIGLGNPGRQYVGTRHNIGFMAVDRLAENWGGVLWKERERCFVSENRPYGPATKVVLAKPQTYMNLSGEAVADLLEWYKIPVDDVIVISDDIDLTLGRIRIRQGGGSGGHRGLASILRYLPSDNFVRIRVGIGRPRQGRDVAEHVLKTFLPEEREEVNNAVAKAAAAVECVIRQGVLVAMNDYNRVMKNETIVSERPPVSGGGE
ncbi:MAG: aminoacyl-tRNA hydrolase [Negativicutes bacterium]|nr:aminoacyl-tRNA hydrolase [Negativicutes bacterium]